jgi:hypothetical protein
LHPGRAVPPGGAELAHGAVGLPVRPGGRHRSLRGAAGGFRGTRRIRAVALVDHGAASAVRSRNGVGGHAGWAADGSRLCLGLYQPSAAAALQPGHHRRPGGGRGRRGTGEHRAVAERTGRGSGRPAGGARGWAGLRGHGHGGGVHSALVGRDGWFAAEVGHVFPTRNRRDPWPTFQQALRT